MIIKDEDGTHFINDKLIDTIDLCIYKEHYSKGYCVEININTDSKEFEYSYSFIFNTEEEAKQKEKELMSIIEQLNK